MNTHNFQLPSQARITIRENTGDDEGLLSDIENGQTGTNMMEYLAAIVETGISGSKPLAEEFKTWKTNDIYYIMLAQRIFNLGAEFKHEFKCRNEVCKKVTNFEEDLREWLVDVFSPSGNTLNIPKELQDTDLNTFNAFLELQEKAIVNSPKAYIYGLAEEADFTISTGKKFKFKFITLGKENFLDTVDRKNINTTLLQRDLQIWNIERWEPVKFFRAFTSKEMSEIRGYVNKMDQQWQPITEFTCPNCKQFYRENLFFLPGFYYPEVTDMP